ncbi:MAG TPA: efflux RND transporter periplasmic adaptor subunit [Pontiella sp.]
MKPNKTQIKFGLIAALVILLTFIAGRCSQGKAAYVEDAGVHEEHVSTEPEVWTCSMHPQIQLPKLGKCPICFMDLIPLEGGDNGGGEREVRVSEYAAKLMELETTPAVRRFGEAEIRMVGKVDYDETRISYISSWIPGRIDRLFVDYTGIPIQKGDHLAEIYSPELFTAQEELLQAIRTMENLKESQSSTLVETAEKTVDAVREKLRLWGFSAKQIAEVEQREVPSEHMTIYSPGAGIVIHKNAQEGMYVQTGTRIYTIADLSIVWVQLDAYESDLNWLKYGGKIDFSTEAYPGEIFAGTISFIDPVITSSTRTAKVRVIVDNQNGRLKPGMFVRALARPKVAAAGRIMDEGLAGKWISPMHPEVIKDEPGPCDVCGMPLVTAESLGYVTENEGNAPLLIPVTAALKTGKRAVVYVEIPNSEKPSYEGREVELGARLGDYYVVESGLDEGERVVTRGAFKLDAELQIRAKPSMMSMPSDGSTEDHSMQMESTTVEMQFVPDGFAHQLNMYIQDYFSLQQALAGDDPDAAAAAVQKAKVSLDQIDMALLEGEAHIVWMDHLKQLNAALNLFKSANKLEAQREAFQALSQQMIKTVGVFPINMPVYQAYCPMAFDNLGAQWLQASKDILNPYFGDMMLKCGEIQKSFNVETEEAEPATPPSTQQKRCPVMGGAINKEVYADHDGMRVYFCCLGCDTTFKENPETYIDQMRAEGIEPEKLAQPQSLCPIMGNPINKEVFVDHNGYRIYFCCPGCDTTFKDDPDKYIEQMKSEGAQPERVEMQHAH